MHWAASPEHGGTAAHPMLAPWSQSARQAPGRRLLTPGHACTDPCRPGRACAAATLRSRARGPGRTCMGCCVPAAVSGALVAEAGGSLLLLSRTGSLQTLLWIQCLGFQALHGDMTLSACPVCTQCRFFLAASGLLIAYICMPLSGDCCLCSRARLCYACNIPTAAGLCVACKA